MVRASQGEKALHVNRRTELSPCLKPNASCEENSGAKISSARSLLMIRRVLLALVTLLFFLPRTPAQSSFTLEQVVSAPFPANLAASKTGGRLAWTLNQQGRRNIWAAEAPEFHVRQLTHYDTDEGQPLSDLHFSSDSNVLVYVR